MDEVRREVQILSERIDEIHETLAKLESLLPKPAKPGAHTTLRSHRGNRATGR
jgi:hypothetical protein